MKRTASGALGSESNKLQGYLRPSVLLFLKAPRRGLVKTRLAAAVGEEHAVIIYRELVESQIGRIPSDWHLEIHFAPANARKEMEEWLGRDRCYQPQAEGDLGDRLSAAVRTIRGGPLFCIGADCPGLDVMLLERAAEVLATGAAQVVFGPAEDGGYYLVGMDQARPEIFRDIPWSGKETLQVSLRRAREAGIQTSLLETRYDVDTIQDWERARRDRLLG